MLGPGPRRTLSIGPPLSELRLGERATGYYGLAALRPVIAYRGGYAFEGLLSDRSGQLPVKYWGGTDPARVTTLHATLSPGGVVAVVGTVVEFRGHRELAVSARDGEALWALSPEEADVAALLPRAKGRDGFAARLGEALGRIEEPGLHALAARLLGPGGAARELFLSAAASSSHHGAELGGLAAHTLRVADLLETLLAQFDSLDADLLRTAGLLHELGALRACETVATLRTTPLGAAVGSVVLGLAEVERAAAAAPELAPDRAVALLGLLAARLNGRREGNGLTDPLPSSPEGMALAALAGLCARLDGAARRSWRPPSLARGWAAALK